MAESAESSGAAVRELRALLNELALDEAACITAVRGADVAEVIRLFGGDPVGAPPARAKPRAWGKAVQRVLGEELLEELAEHPDRQTSPIAVAQAGPAVVVVEYNGFQGTREEVLRPLSRLGGRAASAYWNDDALSELALAEDGLVLSSFEMLVPDHRYGAAPQAWDRYLDGLAFDSDADWRAAGLVAVTRATGARLDREWASAPQLYVEIEEVGSAMLPQGLEDSPLLAEEPFRSFHADLGPGAVPEMERYAVELAARHHGLADDALCTLALAVLDGCGPPEGRSALRAQLAARAAAGDGGASEGAAHGGAGCGGGPAAQRAAVWRTLGDLLAREDGAPVDGPPPMFHLSRAMNDSRSTPESERFWLLHALHQAARGG
ncbi:hypothetical protein ITI46_03215 [Streptomyces oryzae]|uniref:Uncharacterized protein n=1 Tax=Streptomyces oryzae TaxID=1434886 RepID=A0ABS3X5R3_9ACTN|nr:DUF6461 domain-containing protein [Streptomyces oryzae]MBO8190715.1 hypothetical protein [Streptomyces oryzae]